MLDSCVSSVAGGTPVVAGITDGIAAVPVVAAIHRFAESGEITL